MLALLAFYVEVLGDGQGRLAIHDARHVGVGEFGTPGAELRCRQANQYSKIVFDLVPSTTPWLAKKVLAAVPYFSINYLCTCAAKRAQENYINDSWAFQDHAERNLDQKLSTLGTMDQLKSLDILSYKSDIHLGSIESFLNRVSEKDNELQSVHEKQLAY